MTDVGTDARDARPDERLPPPARRIGIAPFAILAALILVGVWLRFASLGRLSLWADEFPHAIGARSLLDGRGPELPSGRDYRRALPQTVLVAASMRAFGRDEAAARVPSAVVGVMTIPALWLAARRRFGDAAALGAAAALTVLPLHVAHSRSARFYAGFVLAYGATAVLASTAIEHRSRRTTAFAIAAFAMALALQISAVMVLAPLAIQAIWSWRRATGQERRARARMLLVLLGFAAGFAIVSFAIPSLRDGTIRLLRDPVPGLRFSPGVHLNTLAQPFSVVSWWAWIALAPLAALGIRRVSRWGGFVCLHLLAPTLLVATAFESTRGRIGSRYLLHLVPFVLILVGLACAEGFRILVGRGGTPSSRWLGISAATAACAITGVFGVWRLPGEAHPATLIPRPNWKAAGAYIQAHSRPGDALLSTGPLAMFWTVGRCGDWIRRPAAAAVYMVGNRDIYCASRLVPDAVSLADYLTVHQEGWIVADPGQWGTVVDPASTAYIERTARRVDVGDPSIFVFRWDDG